MKNDEIVSEEIIEAEIKQEEKKSSSNKYEVVAVKPTFVVLKNGEDIKTIQCNSPTYLVGEIIEL